MRKSLDVEVLDLLVSLVCDTLDTFSAYDVTTLLRHRLPNHNLLHETVKPLVYGYVTANNLKTTDNGTYKVFSKSVKVTGVAAISYDGRDPSQSNVYGPGSGNDIQSQMRQMISGFGNNFKDKVGVATAQVVRKTGGKKVAVAPQTPIISRRYNLLSEGRITLPADLYKNLTSSTGRYTIHRSSNKITITSEYAPSLVGTKSKIRAGNRFRTLFPTNVRMADVNVFADRIEITPVV